MFRLGLKSRRVLAPGIETLENRALFSVFTITSLGDGPGIITPVSGDRFKASTLRAAITAANAHAGADTINFASGVVGVINLGNALPAINDALTISGPGPSKLTVQRSSAAGGSFSIFDVGTGQTATIFGLTIAKGNDGGVANYGTLSLNDCIVANNTRLSAAGGVDNFGTLTANNSSFTGNSAEDNGGGIANNAGHSATLTLCTLSGNATQTGGGGISNAGTLTLTACTVWGNQAGNGGAISNDLSGTAILADCTVAGNSSDAVAGIENLGRLTIASSTVANNSSAFNEAGGIESGGALAIVNTIVAGNLKHSGPATLASDISVFGAGAISAGSAYNIIGTGGAAGLINGRNGNKVGVSLSALKLGPLTNNGGPTRTMALLAGSVAINAGSNALATADKLYADQRGLPRVSGGSMDIGAFEMQTAGGASISGTVFNDRNDDGVRQGTEPGLGSWLVYIDQNKNGVYDPGEIITFTNVTGAYKFTGLSAGTYRIYEVRQDGWSRTKPTGVWPLGYYDVTIKANQSVNGKDFGNFPN